MAYALFKSESRENFPDKSAEPLVNQVRFKVHKFNGRPHPNDRKKVVIVSCFSEFGCEMVGCLYCLPRVTKRYPGRYVIAMGWHGRDYLYRHLVDEFWEIDEEHMGLRDYCYAFHHNSRTLKIIEESASKHGTVLPSVLVGTFSVTNFCRTCGHFWNEWKKPESKCPRCFSTVIIPSIFGDPHEYKRQVVKVPKPGKQACDVANNLINDNCVGIFARDRKTYGRNLPGDFYVNLIKLVEARGHTVVWMGEKQSTMPCPLPHVYDHSRSPLSRDLELTLAIIRRMKFTIQFWTASSRLSGIMGTPYILFESPEQIYSTGNCPGQEGRRLELTTFGPRKVVISHYLSTLKQPSEALRLVDRAIDEILVGDESDIIGLVEDEEGVEIMQEDFYQVLRRY
jgi:hypothetical protein